MHQRIISLSLFLSIFFFASVGSAQSKDLTAYVPKDAKMFIGMNMGALKNTPAYSDVMGFLRQQPKILEILGFLENEGGVTLEKDVEGVLFAFPEPVAATSANAQQTFSIIIRGTLSPERLLEAAKKRYPDLQSSGDPKMMQHTSGDFSFGFPDKKVLVLTYGKADFRNATWKAIADPKTSASASAVVAKVQSQINTSRSMWLIGLTESMPQKGPKMLNAGLTVDVTKGLKIAMIGNMTNSKDAKQAETEFMTLKQQATNPMVVMVGATPLVENLKSSSKKTVVSLSSSMNAKEFDNMRAQVRAVMSQGAQPMPAAPQGSGQTLNPASPVSKDGVKADFN